MKHTQPLPTGPIARWVRFPMVLMALALPGLAADILAIGPDSSFVPDQLVHVVCGGFCTSSAIGSLGDGTFAFNGGLVQPGPGSGLYAIANDATGASSLFSVALDGSNSLIGSAGLLGTGFTGGFAFDGTSYYALANDGTGSYGVYQVSVADGTASALGLVVGTGFNGFTYDAANGTYYGIAGDSFGESWLYSWNMTSSIDNLTAVADLGQGYGGLTYDAASNQLWTIGNVNAGGSALYSLTVAGALTEQTALGDGYSELGAAQIVPEPAAAASSLLGGALLLAGGLRKHVPRRRSGRKD